MLPPRIQLRMAQNHQQELRQTRQQQLLGQQFASYTKSNSIRASFFRRVKLLKVLLPMRSVIFSS